MARYPGAVWRPLPENATEGANRPRLFIVHVIVGGLASANAWFEREDVKTESHFGIGKGHEPDPVRQWIDTRREADTNWDANGISVTVETAGLPSEPFTRFQIDELVDMGRWAAQVHGIPLRLADGYAGSGFGWHSMYDRWNKSHHTCPGAVRIRQLRETVFPAIFEGDDDMPSADEVAQAVWGFTDNSTERSMQFLLRNSYAFSVAAARRDPDEVADLIRRQFPDLVDQIAERLQR